MHRPSAAAALEDRVGKLCNAALPPGLPTQQRCWAMRTKRWAWHRGVACCLPPAATTPAALVRQPWRTSCTHHRGCSDAQPAPAMHAGSTCHPGTCAGALVLDTAQKRAPAPHAHGSNYCHKAGRRTARHAGAPPPQLQGPAQHRPIRSAASAAPCLTSPDGGAAAPKSCTANAAVQTQPCVRGSQPLLQPADIRVWVRGMPCPGPRQRPDIICVAGAPPCGRECALQGWPGLRLKTSAAHEKGQHARPLQDCPSRSTA